MGILKIHRAPEGLRTSGATGVRANIDVRTGEGAIGQAVTGAGRAITDLGVKYDLKEANTQFSEYKSNVGLDREAEKIEIRNEVDINKHTEIAKRHKAIREGLLSKVTNKRGQQAAALWENTQEPLRLAEFNEGRQLQLRDNERTAIFEAQQRVLRSPETLGEFEKQLSRAMFIDKNNPDGTSPTFSQEEAAIVLADTRKMAVVGTVANLYQSGQYDEARNALADSSLGVVEKGVLGKRIDNAETRALNAKTDLDIVVQESAMTDMVSQMSETPDATGQESINESSLSGENKAIFTDIINRRTDVLRAGKPDPWKTNSGNIAATGAISAVLDGTRAEVVKIQPIDIIKRIGEITPQQATSLLNKRAKALDESSTINKPSYKRAIASINRLRNNELASDDVKGNIDAENETEGTFLKMANDLEEFAESIKDDPDFDTKITKKVQSLKATAIDAVTLNWFERMFSPKKEGFFSAVGFNTEAEELVQEKFDILKDHKIWKTLNSAEKKSIRTRFERGATVQEIVELAS